MSFSSTYAIKPAHWLLVATIAFSTTGCMRQLGRSHSSLRPRTASTWEPDTSVFRSQDARLPGMPTITIKAGKPATENHLTDILQTSGHSLMEAAETEPDPPEQPTQPQARLLTPSFATAGSGKRRPAAAGEYSGIVIQPKQQQTETPDDSDLTGSPTSKGSGHSIGFTADHIRQLMDRQSRNDMSDGKVLSELKPKWQVLNTATQTASNVGANSVNTINSGPHETGQQQQPFTSQPATTIQEAAQSREVPPSTDEAAEPTVAEPPAEEPSMLDRLRGFYGPAAPEQKTRQRWMKPFQKLSSPWSVFRDKETTDSPSGDQSPLPPQTVELSDEVEARSSAVNPLLLQLIETINNELQAWPRQPNGTPDNLAAYQRREQDLRLLYLIANEPGSAVAAIDSLPSGDQDFWQEVMLGLAQYRSDEPDVPRQQRLSNTVGQLRTAVRRLAPLTALQIRRIDICSQIYSFGRVETFSLNEFDPGDPILLYVELENFASRLTTTGSYETSFDAQLKFFEDGTDEAIETVELAEITDQSTSERVDYYQSFELTIPSHLTSGRYRIAVQLRDRTSGKKAQESVDFRVR